MLKLCNFKLLCATYFRIDDLNGTAKMQLMVEPMHSAFARRLQNAAHQKWGHNNDTIITSLAKEAGVTYEAARKYWNGLAKPRTPKMILIAKWLDVSPHTLEYGPIEPPADSAAQQLPPGVLGETMRALQDAYNAQSLDDDGLRALQQLLGSLRRRPPTGDLSDGHDVDAISTSLLNAGPPPK